MLTLSENNYFLSSHTPIFIQKFISIPKRFLIGGAGGGLTKANVCCGGTCKMNRNEQGREESKITSFQ